MEISGSGGGRSLTSDSLTRMERIKRDTGIRADGTPMLTESAASTKVPAPAPLPYSVPVFVPASIPDMASLSGRFPGDLPPLLTREDSHLFLECQYSHLPGSVKMAHPGLY